LENLVDFPVKSEELPLPEFSYPTRRAFPSVGWLLKIGTNLQW
jgi:hypothetical protein